MACNVPDPPTLPPVPVNDHYPEEFKCSKCQYQCMWDSWNWDDMSVSEKRLWFTIPGPSDATDEICYVKCPNCNEGHVQCMHQCMHCTYNIIEENDP